MNAETGGRLAEYEYDALDDLVCITLGQPHRGTCHRITAAVAKEFDHLLAARIVSLAEELDDAVCNCIMATRFGKYDGRTVESHLSSLLDDVRALHPAPRETP